MKFLLLYPDWRPGSIDKLSCFSDVWGYYLGQELSRHVSIAHQIIPRKLSDQELDQWFDDLDVSGYDAVLALGLRYFSQISQDITERLKKRLYPGFLCQIYDGSRLDTDGVDITFTVKNDDANHKYSFGSDANRYVRHQAHNEYVGWAADHALNTPAQSETTLRFLIDHTNYGSNPVDHSDDIIQRIRGFYYGGVWKKRWEQLVIRRFDSGGIVSVDLVNPTPVKRYDRIGIPYRAVCQEHGQSHVFFVTHPESVGLVVLETAMAGALTVTPDGFVPQDRLDTVRHVKYKDQIDWDQVLEMIDPLASRDMAVKNTWEQVAKRIRDAVLIRRAIRGNQQ
jgi:hypothetical protein